MLIDTKKVIVQVQEMMYLCRKKFVFDSFYPITFLERKKSIKKYFEKCSMLNAMINEGNMTMTFRSCMICDVSFLSSSFSSSIPMNLTSKRNQQKDQKSFLSFILQVVEHSCQLINWTNRHRQASPGIAIWMSRGCFQRHRYFSYL